MFFYATESFKNARGLTQLEFVELMGLTQAKYANRLYGSVSLDARFKNVFRYHPVLTEAERQLIKEVDRLDQDSKEDVARFKEKVGVVRVAVQRELNRHSPYRIQNLPEFYKILAEMEDHSSTYKLHAVDPNDPRLQQLRRMIGEEPLWEDPERPQSEGGTPLVSTKDRRMLVDSDVRYTTGLRYV